MQKRIKLTEEFDNPGIRGGLDVLLILARTIDKSLSGGAADEFDRSDEGGWIDVIQRLGQLQSDSDTRVADKSKIEDLWKTFLDLNPIKKTYEPELIAVLEAWRDQSVAYGHSSEDPLLYLERANDEGHKIAREVLAEHKLPKQLGARPVEIRIFSDLSGQNYCAGTNADTKTIHWAFQPVPHGLAGMVMADRILAHEYLSHLAPTNSSLELTIREQWLVSSLRTYLEEDPSRPYWKNRLWDTYHKDLLAHTIRIARDLNPLSAKPQSFSGHPGVEEATTTLHYKDRKLSRNLAVELLTQKEGEAGAELALRVAKGLAGQGVSRLDLSKVKNIKDLDDLLAKR
jgi:hypothetical protein